MAVLVFCQKALRLLLLNHNLLAGAQLVDRGILTFIKSIRRERHGPPMFNDVQCVF